MSRRRPSRALLLGVVAGLAVAGCSERREGERRFRYAAAVEVPAAVDERAELAAVFAGFAQRNGLAFHDTSPRAQRLSNGRQTLAMQLQRTLTNGQPWAEIEISAVGNAAAMVTFAAPLDLNAWTQRHRLPREPASGRMVVKFTGPVLPGRRREPAA